MSRDPTLPRRQWLLPLTFSVMAALVLAAGAVAALKVLGPPPSPRLDLGLPATLAVAPGPAPDIPLPATGSFDLVSTDQGQLAAVTPTSALPIGSIAKVMTALVVLHRKPMTGTGPTYTITDQDVGFYDQVIAENGSSLPVVSGEQFTERQLLLALLLPSANNIADTLAVWVAGSETAFVADLNAEAKTLGMTQTGFADASGFSPQTASTAADLVKLGRAALANPTLAALVAAQSAVMPDGSTIQNLDTDLTTVPGWLGIKTGSTSQAGGCFLFAADHPGPLGGGPEVTVVGAVLGLVTPDGVLDHELAGALSAAAAAVEAAFGAYKTVDPGTLKPPVLSGALRSEWGTSADLQATFESGPSAIEFKVGATLRLSATDVSGIAASTVGAGTVVAHVTGRLGGTTVATWEVSATGGLGQPTWQWLLTH
jgi:D-alanyl-D-alanine carboxypeptidase (penicillin-binding protein 5/6)